MWGTDRTWPHMQPRRFLRLLPFVAFSLFLTLGFLLYFRDSDSSLHPADLIPWGITKADGWLSPSQESHPILSLIKRANSQFDELRQKETHDLPSAASRYRTKRGRHPPPGFGKWWQYATDNGVVMIEELWDQIYDDLRPLWALDVQDMMRDVLSQSRIFEIRNGVANTSSEHFWMPIWQDLINSVAADLPNMTLAMNSMDEPRLLIPWESMNELVKQEQKQRWMPPARKTEQNFSAWQQQSTDVPMAYNWNSSGPIWPRIASVCPPDSLARLAPLQTDYSNPPVLETANMIPHMKEGYVENYTLSTSLCHQPDLQGLHGFMIEGLSISTGDKLFPMFGSSKLTVNSEILVPAAMYYVTDPRFTSEVRIPWEEKKNIMVWRGLASGGRNKENNWKGFHRHRLVSMLNGTQAIAMGSDSGFIDIQNLPLDLWHLQTWRNSKVTSEPRNEVMGKWLQSWTDVAFFDLNCYPRENREEVTCNYTDYLFTCAGLLSLEEQHHHKYLVDVDGNSFSGRYRDFLSSASLPIKATIFREWHDSRLFAWKHFVPLDNRFLDIYGIMEFFLGTGIPAKAQDRNATIAERDLMAKKIALDGKDWAEKVLRKEDMQVYMYRLLLEYARIMDENRERLGWVEDLQD